MVKGSLLPTMHKPPKWERQYKSTQYIHIPIPAEIINREKPFLISQQRICRINNIVMITVSALCIAHVVPQQDNILP